MAKKLFWALSVGLSSLLAFSGCADDHPGPDAATGAGGGAAGEGNAAGGMSADGPGAGRPGRAEAGNSGDAGSAGSTAEAGAATGGPKTVLVVLEGLRRELITPERTPNLWKIAEQGVRYQHVSSVLPSNRMAAAASLATGVVPGKHGVLGERMFFPGVPAHDAAGRELDTSQPIPLNDQGTLEALQQNIPGGLLRSKSLIQIAREAGFRTAVIGRSGPASLFDLPRAGWVLNDTYVYPRVFADRVVGLGLGVPDFASTLFPDLIQTSSYVHALEFDSYGTALSPTRFGDYTFSPVPTFAGAISPLLTHLHTYDQATKLELKVAADTLGASDTDLLVLWLRGAGETALRLGPGSPAERDLKYGLDSALGELTASLPEGSNLLIVSDGGTSALAGEQKFFPRFALGQDLAPGPHWVGIDTPGGVPVDGAVRLVDLLARAGFTAYDGELCLSGHAYTSYPKFVADPAWAYPCKINSKNGELTGPALVPADPDPERLIVVSNGASELLYLPSHNVSEITQLVELLHSRPEVGAVFVAPRYATAALPGTLDLGSLGFPPNTLLDLLVTYNWSATDNVAYAPLVDVGQPLKQKLLEECTTKPCRPGLYCDTSLPLHACVFCPPDQPASSPFCKVPESALASAQAVSIYQQEGEPCERSGVCAPGLRCLYATCRQPGLAPAVVPDQLASDFVTGSSYGAMAGVAVDGISTAYEITADFHGVRGGASPADLGSFLIASGPAFKTHTVIDVPSGVIDIAPTLLHVLRPGLEKQLGVIDGRVLEEALSDSSAEPPAYAPLSKQSAPAKGPFYSPTSPETGPATLLKADGTYTSQLEGFTVTSAGHESVYWTQAGANRDSLGCAADTDCPAGVKCGAKGACLVTPSCFDSVKNGLEADVDCGSAAGCLPCPQLHACSKLADCDLGVTCPEITASSPNPVCISPLCLDGVKDGLESDVDCGKAAGCLACGGAQACTGPNDCGPGLSCETPKDGGSKNLCLGPTCLDGLKNGLETDVDCGSAAGCQPCVKGKRCSSSSDCVAAASVCKSPGGSAKPVCGTGVSALCSNGVKDALETDVDCGSESGCDLCDLGQACATASDCTAPNVCHPNIFGLSVCKP